MMYASVASTTSIKSVSIHCRGSAGSLECRSRQTFESYAQADLHRRAFCCLHSSTCLRQLSLGTRSNSSTIYEHVGRSAPVPHQRSHHDSQKHVYTVVLVRQRRLHVQAVRFCMPLCRNSVPARVWARVLKGVQAQLRDLGTFRAKQLRTVHSHPDATVQDAQPQQPGNAARVVRLECQRRHLLQDPRVEPPGSAKNSVLDQHPSRD